MHIQDEVPWCIFANVMFLISELTISEVNDELQLSRSSS